MFSLSRYLFFYKHKTVVSTGTWESFLFICCSSKKNGTDPMNTMIRNVDIKFLVLFFDISYPGRTIVFWGHLLKNINELINGM